MRFAMPPVLLALSLTASQARAHDAGPRPIRGTVSELPSGPVKRKLVDLQSEAAVRGVEPSRYDRPVDQAVRALERARGAREAGDAKHAAMLEQLAAEWTRAAEVTVRAEASERAGVGASGAAKARTEALARARTLLEEAQARLGRLQAQWRDDARPTSPPSSKLAPESPPPTPEPSGVRGAPAAAPSGRTAPAASSRKAQSDRGSR